MFLRSNFLFLFFLYAFISKGQEVDTTQIYKIEEVVIQENKKMKELRSTTPLQDLNVKRLKESGTLQVSDAAKLFSGVVVKDYGGLGGLKTISIRGLGAGHTAVAYDGITLTDAQTGQIDLGKLSLDNIQSMSLSSGQSDQLLQTARLFSAAGVLNLSTLPPDFKTKNINTSVSFKAGSFGLLNPNLSFENKWNKHLSSTILFNYTTITGDYPYTLSNGELKEKRYRTNADVETFKTEANLYGKFENSQDFNLKIYYYQSERGLPTNTLYNTFTSQRLWDKNFFSQARYENQLNHKWSLLTNTKFSWIYNRFYDSHVNNIQGYSDDHYYQNEYYLSATFLYRVTSQLSFSLANDGSIHQMRADLIDFAIPTRYSLLNVLAGKYIHNRFTINAHLLSTFTNEKVKLGEAAPNRHRLSPSISFSLQPFSSDDFRLRLLYKDVFRLPTFNDLYYGAVGSRDLEPEKAQEFNAGVSWLKTSLSSFNLLSFSVDAFYNRITDKIVALPSSNNLFLWSMMNMGKVEIKGMEFKAESEFSISPTINLHLTGNYTWQRALDKTDKYELPNKTTYNHQIPYTPKHSGSIIFGIQNPWINLNYTSLFTGERFYLAYNSNENRMEKYVEHNLSFYRSFQWKKINLNAQFEILNLTDKAYEVVKYYPMPGRQFRGTLIINY